MTNASLLTRLFDRIATYLKARDESRAARAVAQLPVARPQPSIRLLPSLGSVLFTVFSIGALLMANRSGALALFAPSAPASGSTTIMAYQGRLANAAGQPLTTSLDATFRLYDSDAPAAIPLWVESWFGTNQVRVRDGLFSVNLGSITPITVGVIANHPSLFLGITIGGEELQPRTQLGGVPLAFTVPDGAITSSKIADGSVTAAKLGNDVSLLPGVGSITTSMLANGSVTSAQLDPNVLIPFVPRILKYVNKQDDIVWNATQSGAVQVIETIPFSLPTPPSGYRWDLEWRVNQRFGAMSNMSMNATFLIDGVAIKDSTGATFSENASLSIQYSPMDNMIFGGMVYQKNVAPGNHTLTWQVGANSYTSTPHTVLVRQRWLSLNAILVPIDF
jgi:hypothetical protein